MRAKTCIAACALALAVLCGSGAAFAETEAAREYRRLAGELQAKQRTMSPYDYVDYLEKSMKDFIRRYPKSPEAARAHFTLGTVYSSIGAPEKAADHINEYIKSPGEKTPDEVAQAKYVLGTSYIALERFDDAERLFGEIAKGGAVIDRRLAQGASNELSRIGILRRLRVGAPAIAVSAVSHKGKKIELEKYRGKVVLLDFWAVWCAPCRAEMPNVAKIYDEFNKRGFEIIGVSLDDDRAKFEAFVREYKMDWPQIFDGKGWMNEVARSYAVTAIPATFLLDRKGVIRYKNLRGPQLRAAVEQLLADK